MVANIDGRLENELDRVDADDAGGAAEARSSGGPADGGAHSAPGAHQAHQAHRAVGDVAAHVDWQARLRARGYRLTPQRQLVLEAVARLGHATPEAIVTEVRQTASGVNISTVYRTLDLLEELDLVSHTHLGHGPPTYHIAGVEPHVHLICGGCGMVREISPDRLAGFVAELREDLGFTVNVNHVALAGRCAECTAAGRR